MFSGKESVCQYRRRRRHRFHPWIGRIPWRRKWQPTPVFLLGKSHRQRSLAGNSPWGHKELRKTEQLSTQTSLERSLKTVSGSTILWARRRSCLGSRSPSPPPQLPPIPTESAQLMYGAETFSQLKPAQIADSREK